MKGGLGSFAARTWVETWRERVIACVHLRARLIIIECEVGKFWEDYSENMPSSLFEESLKFMGIHIQCMSYCTLFLSLTHTCRITNMKPDKCRWSLFILYTPLYNGSTWFHWTLCYSNSFFMLLGMIPRLIGWQLIVVWKDDRVGEEGWRSKTEVAGGGEEERREKGGGIEEPTYIQL